MKKIHTKTKRKYSLTTGKRQYSFFHPEDKPHRPKTFASEELAKVWAAEKKIKDFSLKSVKKNKRFMIVPAN